MNIFENVFYLQYNRYFIDVCICVTCITSYNNANFPEIKVWGNSTVIHLLKENDNPQMTKNILTKIPFFFCWWWSLCP